MKSNFISYSTINHFKHTHSVPVKLFKISVILLCYVFLNIFYLEKMKYSLVNNLKSYKETALYETIKNVRLKIDLISNISQLSGLEAKNNSLKIILTQKNIEINKYEQYKFLREYLDEQKLSYKHEPSDVLYVSTNSNYIIIQPFLSNLFFEKNQLVVSKEGMLVGKISNVKNSKERIAKVILLSNPLFYIPVKSVKSNVHGIVRGTGFQKNLEMYCFENNCEELQVGEDVVTSGEELNSPKDVFVGTIGNKTENDASVLIPHKNQRLDIVSVLKNEKTSEW